MLRINAVALGAGDKSHRAIGGQNVLPFHTFDAPIGERSRESRVEVKDTDARHGGIHRARIPEGLLRRLRPPCVDMAKRAETLEGASVICLHLEGADPNGENKSVEECVQLAKDVCRRDRHCRLVIMGCKNIEKDTELFNKISDALPGQEHPRSVRP